MAAPEPTPEPEPEAHPEPPPVAVPDPAPEASPEPEPTPEPAPEAEPASTLDVEPPAAEASSPANEDPSPETGFGALPLSFGEVDLPVDQDDELTSSMEKTERFADISVGDPELTDADPDITELAPDEPAVVGSPAFGGDDGPLPAALFSPTHRAEPTMALPEPAPQSSSAPKKDTRSGASRREQGEEPAFDLSATPEDDSDRVSNLRPSRSPLVIGIGALVAIAIAVGAYALKGSGEDPNPTVETPVVSPAEPSEPVEAIEPATTEAPEAPAPPAAPSAAPSTPTVAPSSPPKPGTPTSAPSAPTRSTAAPEEDIVPRIDVAPPKPNVDPATTAPSRATPEPAAPVEEPPKVVAEPPKPAVETPPPTPAPVEQAPFTVTFRIGDPSITSLSVKCNTGTPSGNGPVVVSNALPGPCRVQGSAESGGVVAFFDLRGPGDFTCFEGGSRACK